MMSCWGIIISVVLSISLLPCVTPNTVAPRPKAECPAPDDRFDCHPELDPTREKCETRGCCWDSLRLPLPGVPICYYPQNYGGYRTTNVTESQTGTVAFLERAFPSPYPRDVKQLLFETEDFAENIIRVKISDPSATRFEPPYPKIEKPTARAQNDYKAVFDSNRTGFKIQDGTGRILFDALNTEGLIFADQFIQISTLINGRLFGIGEHRTNITIEPGWKRFSLFNYGGYPEENINLYGSHPFYMVVPEDHRAYGVFLHNSNAMDVMLSPKPALTFRTIGGILDFYIFLGPTPAAVVQQYTQVVGRTLIPPYWSLGFHLCKYGYDSIENMRATVLRNIEQRIPFDAQWSDIDSMNNQNDFTYDPERFAGLPEFVAELHERGMKMVPIVDAGVSASEPKGTYPPFDLGVDMDVLVKDQNGSIYIGKVWNPVSTAYPDFTHPKVQDYWNQLLADYHQVLPFDGIWIDMNEPSNFYDGTENGCPESELERPPYTPGVVGDNLAHSTLCMTAQQAAGTHYNVHNLYSISQAEVTNKALRSLGKRPFVLSRSTFSGSGRYTGHWSGDTLASYYDMTKSIQELLTMNMYGVSLMGADICGFRQNTNPELCSRWFQLGSFYTFTRNHNDLGWNDQDPAVFDESTVDSIRKSLNMRYALLPYLYTLFYRSHSFGDTVARPLFFEFSSDARAYEVEKAFMWGSSLYIIPVLEEGVTSVAAYCPGGLWYDIYTGIKRQCKGEYITLYAPYDTIPILLRGGSVITVQVPGVTTTESRKNNMELLIGPDEKGEAYGEIYWDDGEVIDPVENLLFSHASIQLRKNAVTFEHDYFNSPYNPMVNSVTIFGAGQISNATVNDEPANIVIDPRGAATIRFSAAIQLSKLSTVKWQQ